MRRIWKNTEYTWGSIAKILHWLIAMLIVAQLVLGTLADDAALSPLKLDLFVWHKSVGLSILLLVTVRLGWRLHSPPPSPLASIPLRETILAKVGHTLLYALLFGVPLSGWWVSDASRVPFKAFWILPLPDLLPADRAMQELAEDVHYLLIRMLLAVVIVHIAAALRHHFLLRNDTLRRMLPGQRQAD